MIQTRMNQLVPGLDPGDWRYKNEGAEHIVVQFTGDKNNAILVSLALSPEFIEKLNDMIHPYRPTHRNHEPLDKDIHEGILMQDLTLLPKEIELTESIYSPFSIPITVEIKPKWGGLPVSPHIKRGNQDVKYNTCRYCMHQVLKHQDKSIDNVSQYCPVDLFSNQPDRIKKALFNMMEEPQNNLKIYCGGQLSFTGKLGGGTNNQDILADHLGKVFPQSPADSLMDVIGEVLTADPVLTRLKKLQEMDTLDIEGIHYLYQKRVLNQQPDNIDLEHKHHLDDLTDKEIDKKIAQFLFAAAAKDCSIMILLFPLLKEHATKEVIGTYPVIQVNNTTFLYRITVIDIDPKPLHNITSYYELDQLITHVYKQHGNSKSCK